MNKIQFKGNVITRSFVIAWVLISALSFIVQNILFVFIIDEVLFQLTGGGSFFVYFLCLIVTVLSSIHIGQKSVYRLYGDQVEIIVDSKCWEIWYNRELKYRINPQSIKSLVWLMSENTLDRITIKTDSTICINVGSIWKGIENAEVNTWLLGVANTLARDLKTKVKETVTEVKKTKKKNYLYVVLHPDIEKVLVSKRMPVSKTIKILIVLMILLVSVLSILAIVSVISDDDPYNQVGRLGVSYSNSNYLSYNGDVYFLRIGDGYFKVKDADFKTFRPLLRERQYGSDMGVDTSFVFCGTEKLKDIDRRSVRYIGAYFVADAHSVFYKNRKIENADPQTFDLAIQQYSNSYKYPYGRDNKHLFYKHYLLNDMNPDSARVFERTFDYISDNKNAYYRNVKLKGVEAENFNAEYVDYQLTYATDGQKYYVNGKQLPDQVQNIYWGSTEVDKASLKLLTKKQEFSYHMLFYDANHIYYFDESRQEFVTVNYFDRDISFTELDNGIWADGTHIYFVRRNVRAYRTRGGGRRRTAELTQILLLEDKKASDFKKVRELDRSVLWSNGTDFYLSGYSAEKYSDVSLWKLKSEPKSDIVEKTNILEIPAHSEWITVKTRVRRSFEKEVD